MRSPLLECYWLVWSQHLTPSGPWRHALEPLVQAGIEIGIQFRREMKTWHAEVVMTLTGPSPRAASST